MAPDSHLLISRVKRDKLRELAAEMLRRADRGEDIKARQVQRWAQSIRRNLE